MQLRRITVRHIQSLDELTVELPRTGLVRFCGANSNGKSIIRKMTEAVITGQFSRPEQRNSFINRHSLWGEIEYEDYGGNTLLVHLEHQASGVFVKLTNNKGESIQRYMQDKPQVLIEKFGFIYNKERDIALQVVSPGRSTLYLSTSPRTNYDMLNTALTDEQANTALEQLQEVYKSASEQSDAALSKVQVINRQLSQLKFYNKEQCTDILEHLKSAYKKLEAFYIPTIPEVPDMTPVTCHDVYSPSLPEIPEVNFTTYSVHEPSTLELEYRIVHNVHRPNFAVGLLVIHKELEQLRQNICPTCGQPIKEVHEHE